MDSWAQRHERIHIRLSRPIRSYYAETLIWARAHQGTLKVPFLDCREPHLVGLHNLQDMHWEIAPQEINEKHY